MNFRQNPFYVLNAAAQDSRYQLQQLVEDAQLSRSAAGAEDAYTALIKPESRLAAELRWLPGADAQTQAAVRTQLAQGEAVALDEQFTPLARMNALLHAFASRQGKKSADQAGEVREICRLWGEQDPDELLESINAQRFAGGWKQVQPEQLRMALKAYLEEIAIWLTGTFRGNGREGKKLRYAYADALLELVKRYEARLDGYAYNELIEELVSRFELETAAQAAEEKARVLNLTDERHHPPKVNWSALKTDGMNYALKRWHRLTYPARLLAQARGMHWEDASGMDVEHFANEVAGFMAEVFNRFRDVTGALSIIYCMQKCFPELDEMQELLKKDAETIKSAMRGTPQKTPAYPKLDQIKWILMIGVIVLAAILSRCDIGSEDRLPDPPRPLPPVVKHDITRHLPPELQP